MNCTSSPVAHSFDLFQSVMNVKIVDIFFEMKTDSLGIWIQTSGHPFQFSF